MDDWSRKAVARQAFLGLLRLIFALALMLFGPAWTLDFWQAWTYLFVFGGAAALITIYLWREDPDLLQRRVHAGPRAETERRQKLILVLASLAFVGSILLPALDHRVHWSSVPIGAVVVGDLLVALGFLIVFFVFRENTFTAGTITVAADQKVVSTGPYAIVRHPMYLGGLVLMLGTPVALGSWWGLLTFIPMSLVIVWRLLDEERYLSENLPGYTEYLSKTRYRLLPCVW